jgi:hypothetical protein
LWWVILQQQQQRLLKQQRLILKHLLKEELQQVAGLQQEVVWELFLMQRRPWMMKRQKLKMVAVAVAVPVVGVIVANNHAVAAPIENLLEVGILEILEIRRRRAELVGLVELAADMVDLLGMAVPAAPVAVMPKRTAVADITVQPHTVVAELNYPTWGVTPEEAEEVPQPAAPVARC